MTALGLGSQHCSVRFIKTDLGNGDLLEMDMETSAAARRVVGDRLGLAERSQGETTGGMRASAKVFTPDLLNVVVP